MVYIGQSLLGFEKRDASCEFILLLTLLFIFCSTGIKPKALNMRGRFCTIEQSLSWDFVL